VLWLKNHFPATWQSAHRFYDLADFLVSKATATDVAGLCTLTCKWNYLAQNNALATPARRR
jgi:ribulose kinase